VPVLICAHMDQFNNVISCVCLCVQHVYMHGGT